MTLPSVEILVRVRDGMPYLQKALETVVAQDYEGPLTVRVAVDARTSDSSIDVARWVGVRDGKPNHRWLVSEYPATTLFEMSVRILSEVTGEAAFLLDSDNILYPDRVSASISSCWPGPGLCVCQVESTGPSGKAPMTASPAMDLELTREHMVSMLNWADSLDMRWRTDFVRAKLLPAMRQALQLGGGLLGKDFVDDYFCGLIATHYGEFCKTPHPAARPLAEYRYRDDALSKTTNMYSRAARTGAAYWILVQRGFLGESPEPLHEDLLATIPKSRGGKAPG